MSRDQQVTTPLLKAGQRTHLIITAARAFHSSCFAFSQFRIHSHFQNFELTEQKFEYLYTTPSISSPSAGSRSMPAEDRVHKFISDLITSILDDLMGPNARASITIKQRFQRGSMFHLTPLDKEGGGALGVTAIGPEIYTTYSWPGKTVYETWKFSMDNS